MDREVFFADVEVMKYSNGEEVVYVTPKKGSFEKVEVTLGVDVVVVALLLAVTIGISVGLALIGRGITRSAAIQKGMTPEDYERWHDEVNGLIKNQSAKKTEKQVTGTDNPVDKK